MALPSTLLLPFALIPLSISEARHRALARHALEHDRMICIALVKPESVDDADETAPPSPPESVPPGKVICQIGGIGLIRACVTLPSGNFNLILQGIARVGLSGWKQTSPFRIAYIQPLPNRESETAEAAKLCEHVLELCDELKDRGAHVPLPIEKQLAAIRDPSALADIVSHTFIADPIARQQLLEELNVPTRLRHLITQLETELLG